MIHPDSGWRLFAIAISILLHGTVVFLVLKETTMSADIIMAEQPVVTQIRLEFAPEPEPEQKKEPEPDPEPAPRPKPKPKPKKEIKKQKPKSRQQEEKIASGREKRDDYLSYVVKRIESKKFYPRAAARRTLKGVIRVNFTVLCDGSVVGLRTGSGNNILQKAALQAVKKALPFRKPERCPREITYRMKYGS